MRAIKKKVHERPSRRVAVIERRAVGAVELRIENWNAVLTWRLTIVNWDFVWRERMVARGSTYC